MDGLTVSRRRYALHQRLLDALVAPASWAGLLSLEPEDLVASARRATGLDDFGDDGWQEALEVVARDAARRPITHLARAFIRETYGKGLRQRLALQDHLRRHPEIADVRVERPLFVLGFPRTGTTVLQNLLALDPSRRGLRFWELITPLPLRDGDPRDEARRIALARNVLRAARIMAPEQALIHDVRADTFEECWYLFCNTFRVLNWDIQGMEDYGEWLMEADLVPAYEEYRTWLQVLLHQRPADQLLLKCPEHLWFVDALLEVFPDACIVWTHRDPAASVGSYASLMSLTHRTLFGQFEPTEMGPFIQRRLKVGVERAMAARDRWGREENFHDVAFEDVVRDPAGVVAGIAEHFDLPMHPGTADAVAAWQASPARQDKRGRHRYRPEAFGIDPGEVARDFAPYVERFGIPVAGGDRG